MTNKIKNEVPIFFSIDDAYAPYLATALNSAIQNCSPDRDYRAIVLYKNLSEENKDRIISLATDNFAIEFVEMQHGFESIKDRESNRLRCDYFTLTIYFRLFIPRMFPQYDKAIYIDSDIVVLGDLAELYDKDLGEKYIGACRDLSIVDIPELVHYTKDAVGMNDGEYINSGVLLMNLKLLREKGFDTHFLNLLNTYHFDSVAPDQDYINAICNGKILYLDEEWDAMPNDARAALPSPKLIHYNLFSKPWCYDGVQYGDYFWHYAEDSGYIDEIVVNKLNYSEEQKKSDGECLRVLISKGNSICDGDITFKKMHESGVKIRL